MTRRQMIKQALGGFLAAGAVGMALPIPAPPFIGVDLATQPDRTVGLMFHKDAFALAMRPLTTADADECAGLGPMPFEEFIAYMDRRERLLERFTVAGRYVVNPEGRK